MDIFATIFAGLGLFFIGVKGIGVNLKQMTGRRFRSLIARATCHPSLSAALGTLTGALTQSTNAVTFVIVSMVTAGLVQAPRALPIVVWANVGTSALVLLAAIDIHLFVLYLLGVLGLFHYLDLNSHDRYRHLIGTLLGVGLLFLGLWLIKSGTAPLKEVPWVQAALSLSANSFALAFGIGALLTLVAQSSATVAVVAVTMTSVGLLSFDQTLMIVFGASVGSGLSTWLMSRSLTGTGRQLAMIQVWLKFIGVLLLLPWFLAEVAWPIPGPKQLAAELSPSLDQQVAWIYLMLQLASASAVSLLGKPLYRLAQRLSPPDAEEALGRPKYLYEQALEEAESALDLVEKEQARLIERLPAMLDALRPEQAGGELIPCVTLYRASSAITGQVRQFLAELMGRAQSSQTLERVINIGARNDLLIHLQDGCLELVQGLETPFDEASAQEVRMALLESLHMLLSMLNDSASGDPDDIEMLTLASADHSGIMENIRSDLLKTRTVLDAESQTRLFAATSLFERLVWLVHRFNRLLQRQHSPH